MTDVHAHHRRHRLLWIAFAAPALGWFVQLCAGFTLAAYACAANQMWILHTISGAALVAGLIGVVCGWKARDLPSAATSHEEHFLVRGTLAWAALLVLAIVAGEVGNWYLVPCV